MAGPTANEIKTQIKALLNPVIGTALTRKTTIFDYMALAFKPAEGEDPTILRSSLDPVTLAGGEVVNRVNCLMISEEAFSQRVIAHKDSTHRSANVKGKNVIPRRFRLTYFYQFGGASENTFSTNVELIRTTLNTNPKLGFAMVTAGGLAGPGAFIEEREEDDVLQMPSMLPDAFGDVICHVAEGFLTVRVIEALG